MNRSTMRPSPRAWAGAILPIAAVALAVIASAAGCSRPPAPRAVEWPFDPSYATLDRLLNDHATPRGLRYADLAKDPSDLKILKLELAEVTARDFASFTREARLAYLVNVHNVYALDRIIREYPVDSIEETRLLGSALKVRDIRAAGRKWSLLELRETVMGPEFKDARALFLLNWGMRGCPPLPPVAPTADNLDQLLERQTFAFIRNEDYNRLARRQKRFHVSALLGEYRTEIERDYTTMHLFLERFAQPDDSLHIRSFPPRIAYGRFDTTLNEAVELPARSEASASP